MDRESLNRRANAVIECENTDFFSLKESGQLDPATSFRHSKLRNQDFTGCDLSGYDFTGSDLRGSIFTRAKITNAEFSEAIVDLADLAQAYDWKLTKSLTLRRTVDRRSELDGKIQPATQSRYLLWALGTGVFNVSSTLASLAETTLSLTRGKYSDEHAIYLSGMIINPQSQFDDKTLLTTLASPDDYPLMSYFQSLLDYNKTARRILKSCMSDGFEVDHERKEIQAAWIRQGGLSETEHDKKIALAALELSRPFSIDFPEGRRFTITPRMVLSAGKVSDYFFKGRPFLGIPSRIRRLNFHPLININEMFSVGVTCSFCVANFEKDFLTRPLCSIENHAQNSQTTIYQIVNSRRDATKREVTLVARFKRALAHYQDRRIQEASQMFDKLQRDFPEDIPSQLYSQHLPENVRPYHTPHEGMFVRLPPPHE